MLTTLPGFYMNAEDLEPGGNSPVEPYPQPHNCNFLKMILYHFLNSLLFPLHLRLHVDREAEEVS